MTPPLDLQRPFGEAGIEPGKGIARNRRDVGAKGEDFGTARQDVIGGDVVPQFDQHRGLEVFRQGFAPGDRFDVGTSKDLLPGRREGGGLDQRVQSLIKRFPVGPGQLKRKTKGVDHFAL